MRRGDAAHVDVSARLPLAPRLPQRTLRVRAPSGSRTRRRRSFAARYARRAYCSGRKAVACSSSARAHGAVKGGNKAPNAYGGGFIRHCLPKIVGRSKLRFDRSEGMIGDFRAARARASPCLRRCWSDSRSPSERSFPRRSTAAPISSAHRALAQREHHSATTCRVEVGAAPPFFTIRGMRSSTRS